MNFRLIYRVSKQKKILLIIAFLLCVGVKKTFAQDSSLIKLNYGFSYDRHNYSKYSYGSDWIKPQFCYSNSVGILINHYFFKRKRLGIGLQVTGGNKRMSLIGEYTQMIDSTPHRVLYATQKDYNFKYDYWLFGLSFRIGYIIKERIEPFIGYEKSFDVLNKQNFKKSSIINYTNHASAYEYLDTYTLDKNLNTDGFFMGLNVLFNKKIEVGLLTAYKVIIQAWDLQGRSIDNVGFSSFVSYEIRINYSLF